MTNRTFYAFWGFFIGLISPLLWLAGRAVVTQRAYWASWFFSEMNANVKIYCTVGIIAIVIFPLVGYVIGKQQDDIIEEAEKLKHAHVTLNQMAATDGLTGLLNAATIREKLDEEIKNENRFPVTSLLIDIDHFKKINDQYGHPFGDEVLVHFAQILLMAIRHVDIVGRLGGEEFLLILPNTPEDRAMIVAERIRSAVEKTIFNHEEKTVPVTASIGVVSYPQPGLEDRPSLLKAVDDAMYGAKKSGRNKIVVWKEEAFRKSI